MRPISLETEPSRLMPITIIKSLLESTPSEREPGLPAIRELQDPPLPCGPRKG